MKKIFAAAALLLGTLLPAVQPVFAAPQSFDGTISDSMCGKKHMMPGKSDAECTKACIKGGSSYVLVTDQKVYTLSGKPDQVAPFAGKHVKVKGELKQDTITVSSIQ
jgi:hypothetical protein